MRIKFLYKLDTTASYIILRTRHYNSLELRHETRKTFASVKIRRDFTKMVRNIMHNMRYLRPENQDTDSDTGR